MEFKMAHSRYNVFKKNRKQHKKKYDLSVLSEYIPAMQDGTLHLEILLNENEQQHVQSIINAVRNELKKYGSCYQLTNGIDKVIVKRKL